MKEEEQDNQIPSSSTLPHHQNGRSYTPAQPVTVASASPHKILTLALPIQQPRPPTTGGGGSGGGGALRPPSGGVREDCWSDMATSILIDAWGERYLELSRGNLKQNHWKDVADIVSSRDESRKLAKTDVQCKNRIDTLKKKYKLEKSKIVSGQGPSKWIFFDRIDQLIGSNTKISTSAAAAYTRGADLDSGQRILRPLRHIQQDKRQQTMNSNSSQEAAPPSPDSTDSLPPPETSNRKRPHFEVKAECNPNPRKRKKVKGKGWGESMRELSRAIQEFGQAYERMESSKLQQMVEIEKQRMGLAKDLELKRMQFFMETQMELTQVKGRIVSNKHHNNITINNKRNKK